MKRAKDILKETGADDIASAGEATADFAKSDKPMPRRAARRIEKVKRESCHPPTVDEKLADTVELDSEDRLTKRTSGTS